MATFSEEVATIIRSTRGKLLPFWGNVAAATNKGRGPIDHVTALDLEIEKYLTAELARLDSSIGFFGEEFGGSRDQERFWLCDPIDGTGHFIRGLPFCTVMLALIEKGEVTLSFIYDFVRDELYHAQRGKGAYCNEAPIHVSERPLGDAYISWETHVERGENMTLFTKLRTKAALFKTLSAGYEFAMVASGKLDGRLQFDPHGQDWDFAPGSLLVSEAGGVVANIGTRTYHYANRDFIAATPQVFEGLTTGPDAIFPIA